MLTIDHATYRDAFTRYLRKGIPIELSLKANERISTHYIWRTEGDDKVRSEHAANEGRIFAWDNPPATGHPGTAENCRCVAVPYYGLVRPNDPPLEPVYPELLMLPLLRVGRLFAAWRELLAARNTSRDWQLSPTKSEITWRNRIEKGNWTPDKITNTLRYGKRNNVINERTGAPATRYELDGRYLVRDDKTGDILQLSGPNHIAKKF